MSPTDTLAVTRFVPRTDGLFRSELRYVFRRPRTYAMLGLLAAVPVLIGVALKVAGHHQHDNNGSGNLVYFVGQTTNNGLFLVFASLAATLPFFLPLTVGVVSGDAVAGEASGGTLRYLLTSPAGRGRLLTVKFAGITVFCLAATFVVSLTALVTGLILFPVGRVPLLSGDTVSFWDAMGRAVVITLLVAVSLLGIAAVGLFLSTLTTVTVAAMAATVGMVIVAAIVEGIPQLSGVHPWLFSHNWLSFGDLLRAPIRTSAIVRNLEVQAAYVAVFFTAAWSRLSDRDITT